MFCLVMGHELAKRRENEDQLGSRLQELKFGDLRDEPLGSVPSILFWNDQQRQIYTRVTRMKHTLLVGDYGTGLCIKHCLQLLLDIIETGKTLILEAAAKTLSERDDTQVVFICALGEECENAEICCQAQVQVQVRLVGFPGQTLETGKVWA